MNGFFTPAVIVSIVFGVADVGLSLLGGAQAKGQSGRQANIDAQRLENERLDRELRQQQEQAQRRQEDRKKKADIVNAAAVQGVLIGSSATERAIKGVDTKTRRDDTYIASAARLADDADEITRQQAALNRTAREEKIFSTQLASGVDFFSGVATAAIGSNAFGTDS